MRIALALDDQAHAVAIRLIADVGDPVDLLLLDEIGDLLGKTGLVDLVGQLCDDDRGALLACLLERDCGLHHDAAAPMRVHLANCVDAVALARERIAPLLEAEDRGAGGKVGAIDVAAQLVVGQRRVVDERDGCIGDLAQVMGRDIRGHAHRDAG